LVAVKEVDLEELGDKLVENLSVSKNLYKKFILDVSNREDNKKIRELYSI
jgi:hypothetical protein